MKKIKIFTLGISLIASTCFYLNSVHAVSTVNNKQINSIPCKDVNGNVTGYGNTCVDSKNYNCLANPCSSRWLLLKTKTVKSLSKT